MNIIKYPSRDKWTEIAERPHLDVSQLNATVASVLADVKARGDKAVMEYEHRFDHAVLGSLAVSEQEFQETEQLVSDDLEQAIRLAHYNIHKFHDAQRFHSNKVETGPGITCWQKSVAIERVGLYIPGGTAPLFSTVLMLATPAKIAGCKEIVLCTPPNSEGKINPAILVAARTAGVSKVFKAGGVQAIGAMAYGTESVPKVFKIFGPGNQYVMAAKQQVSLHDVAIDMPAGPSEVCVIADDKANATFVAADLLSQAEHGTDSQVLLITTSERMLNEVKEEVERQLELLPRKDMAAKTLENSQFVLVGSPEEAIALSNFYAPEHLIIQTEDYEQLAEEVVNAGSVFLGKYACESAGDYASGTNHTLPTHGYATAYSGVNLDSYCRKITFQHLTEEGVQHIGHAVELMAGAEQLDAHKNAMTVRINSISTVEPPLTATSQCRKDITEKTATRSTLNSRGYERSEHPRTDDR
jgi:histidinol dehydrogenase